MPQASGALPAEPATRSAIVTVLLDGSDDRDIQDAATPGSPVSVADLARFAVSFADLADPDVMSQAWT
jgi:hypothetical protein